MTLRQKYERLQSEDEHAARVEADRVRRVEIVKQIAPILVAIAASDWEAAALGYDSLPEETYWMQARGDVTPQSVLDYQLRQRYGHRWTRINFPKHLQYGRDQICDAILGDA